MILPTLKGFATWKPSYNLVIVLLLHSGFSATQRLFYQVIILLLRKEMHLLHMVKLPSKMIELQWHLIIQPSESFILARITEPSLRKASFTARYRMSIEPLEKNTLSTSDRIDAKKLIAWKKLCTALEIAKHFKLI